MKRVYLNTGDTAIVDDDVYADLCGQSWYLSHGYARGTFEGRHIVMHRHIIAARRGQLVDHINGNKLDNRRSNLRIVSTYQNQHNRGPNGNNTSGFKGVSWNRKVERWEARIRIRGRKLHIGCFHTNEQAALAYDIAVSDLHGRYARPNFIPVITG